jgi:hypothetical protein
VRERLLRLCPECGALVTFRWLESTVREMERVRPYAHKTEGGWCVAAKSVYVPGELHVRT